MAPDQVGRLQDILNAATLIAGYVRDVSKEQFVENIEKKDAIVSRIEIIGEATAHLTDETRDAIPELPFRKIRGMRNIVAHDYANVNTDVVWDVATIHVPQMIAVLEPLLAKQIAVPDSSPTDGGAVSDQSSAASANDQNRTA